MSELSAEDLDRLREGLLDAKAELSNLIRTTESDTRPVDLDEPIGRLSRMDALQQQSMAAANRGAALLRHRQIEAALSRLDAGEFGECQSCGEEIEAQRLFATPEVPFCLNCQSQREQRRSDS
jgi:DnaK suppressor protein